MPKRPTESDRREAARILREVLQQTKDANTADAGAKGVVRRVEGAIVGPEAGTDPS